MLSVLRGVLENPSIVKVFHDCRGDAQEFREALDMELNNIIDTQMMHAFVTVRVHVLSDCISWSCPLCLDHRGHLNARAYVAVGALFDPSCHANLLANVFQFRLRC